MGRNLSSIERRMMNLLEGWATNDRLALQQDLMFAFLGERTHARTHARTLLPLLRKTVTKYSWYTDTKIYNYLAEWSAGLATEEVIMEKMWVKVERPTRIGQVSFSIPLELENSEGACLAKMAEMAGKLEQLGDSLTPHALEQGEATPPKRPGGARKATGAAQTAAAGTGASSLPKRPGGARKATGAAQTAAAGTGASSLPKRPGRAENPPPVPPSKVDRAVADQWLATFAEQVCQLHPEIEAYDDEAYNDFVFGKLTELSNMSYDELCNLNADHFTTTTQTVEAALVL